MADYLAKFQLEGLRLKRTVEHRKPGQEGTTVPVAVVGEMVVCSYFNLVNSDRSVRRPIELDLDIFADKYRRHKLIIAGDSN